MSNTKISILGAGGSFTIGMVHDICLTPSLHDCELSFMDTDQERLDHQVDICLRYAAEEMNVRLNITKTGDRRAAMAGADFVVTIALIDGARRLRDGWAISEKHGFRFPGSFHIMYDEPFWLNFYQLRFFEEITRDMLEICPRAWHLMVSNPVLAGTTHLHRKYPEANMVGLCHGFCGVHQIADVLGLRRDHLHYEIPGVNHFVWLTSLRHEGEDVFPMLDRWIAEKAEGYWAEHGATSGAMSRKSINLYKKFGALPIGDSAGWTGASWPWWYHSDGAVEKRWGVDSRQPWQEYVDWLGKGAEHLQTISGDRSKKVSASFPGIRPGELTGEPMIPIVDSVVHDIPRVIIVNTQNDAEYVPGIPRDFEVEIPALVSGSGIQGIQTHGLPRPLLAHILRDRVAPTEMELAAYEQGKRELLVQLILMDKWVASEAAANAFLDDIFALPYHGELRAHYS